MSVKRDSQNSVKNRTISAINSGGGGGSATSYQIRYLAVAGGGGGGYGPGSPKTTVGGGGGGGGFLQSQALLTIGVPYTITVGAGGNRTPSVCGAHVGGTGSNTTICGSGFSVTTYGGGGGGGGPAVSGTPGGSGGGGPNGLGGTSGTGVSGQGNPGGSCFALAPTNPTCNFGNGGGGGAGSPGFKFPATGFTSPTVFGGGQGGYGAISDISGTVQYYSCGGGGASVNNGVAATGGYGLSTYGTGGPGRSTPVTGSVAGSPGIVIISYVSPTQKGTGGTVTSYSPPTSPSTVVQVHTFSTAGSFTYTG